MPLQNFQYDTIMREYSRKQAENRRLLEAHRQEAYDRIPRLREIDSEVASLSAAKARSMINGLDRSLEDLKAAISLLAQEREALLALNGYPSRIPAISAARNAPVSTGRRYSFCILSPI